MMDNAHTQQWENVIFIFYYIDLTSVFKGVTLATYEIARTLEI